jgi:nucleoside 2-deoxyribosyltransferase
MKYLSTKKPVTCYLASGWFNPPQEQARQEMIKVLEDNEISYFSPKDEVEVKFDATHEERQAAFKADTEVIKHCDFVIASTVNKDMGTLMEMGMAYAWETPFIVYFPAPPGTPCNLMISESAFAVAQSPEELDAIIKKLKATDFDFSKRYVYEGGIE